MSSLPNLWPLSAEASKCGCRKRQFRTITRDVTRRLIEAIVRGRAGFEELAAGPARSLRELAERDGITRRCVRRVSSTLAFLSPELVEVILQGRQSIELTATRLAELDLPLDWHDQRRLSAP